MKNYADLGGNILLNPSKTDGCREGAKTQPREESAGGKNQLKLLCRKAT